MSGVKGVVNRNAKTSGKNTNSNTASQNADTKDAVPNKTHDKEKLQVNVFFIIFNLCLDLFFYIIDAYIIKIDHLLS